MITSFKIFRDPYYPLDGILLLSLLAVLASAEGFIEIMRFGKKRLSLLRHFRSFAAGTPSHDHLGNIFAMRESWALQRYFVV